MPRWRWGGGLRRAGRRQPRRDPRPARASAGPRSRGRHRGGDARGAADQARRGARPARGDGALAGHLAGAPSADGRASAHRRLRRQSRRRGARRLGLSGRGDGADGAELHRRRGCGQPALPGRRRRSPGLRDEPRQADRRHRRGAGDERGGMRPRHRLRHDGGRAGDRRAGARRDGDRQHDRRRGAVLALFGGEAARVGRPRHRRRRRRARAEARGRRRRRRPPRAGRRATRSNCCAGWAGSNSPRSPAPILAARMGRVPVVLDGFCSTAAAAVLYAADPRALDHCVVGHVSAEPGHRRLLDRIGRSRSSISACASAKPPARPWRSAC